MTTTIRRASSIVIVAALAFTMYSCTDDSQQKMIDQQRQTEQREAQDKADRDQRAAQEAASQPQATATPVAEQTPEAPPEPEKIDNVVYKNIQCQCHEVKECGVTMWGCSDGKTHACMHDVEYTIIQVDKTDSNDGNCGT